ncbi:2-succinylbenzoate-CoA ligase [Halobacteriales archaeon QS_8_69_26]|nr:MAG: 2-succinylbenzoate-CoA ligase [Halobacteriales archaeon QS_8_69_26]
MTAEGDPYPATDERGGPSAWRTVDAVARRARDAPDATALVDAPTGKRVTYAELDRAVGETVGRLAALGIEPGDNLGVVMETRPATVRVVHAAARLGAVLVGLNVRDTPAAVAEAADRADVTALVCGREAEDLAAAAARETAGSLPVASVDAAGDPEVTALGDRDPAAVDPHRWGLADPRTILFTSGTTGEPKPVVLTAGNLLASATASAFRLGVVPGDRWYCALPTYHMGGLAPLVRSALYGTAVVVGRTADGFDPERVHDRAADHGATAISLVPTQLRRILDARNGVPDSLRFVLLGGGPVPEDLVRRCDRLGVPVAPTYGTTETASQIATVRPGETADHPDSVGRPLPVTEVRVVGPDRTERPPGEPGAIEVAGPTVTPGYYGTPAATAEAFDGRWFLTGDRGVLGEDGRLSILGRTDDLITTGGETVSPQTVRDALVELAGIEDAAVVGIEDPEWGERVAVLVVPAPDADPSTEDVMEGSRDRLAGYERPKTVAFADELPRTPSGTVDREAVRGAIRERTEG